MLCHFCLFLSCVLGVFNSPVATPAHELLGLSPSLRLRYIYRRTRACLLCIFVPPPTVPLHLVVNSDSFLWTVSLFIYFRSVSVLSRSCCSFAGDLNKTISFVVGVLSTAFARAYPGSSNRALATLYN